MLPVVKAAATGMLRAQKHKVVIPFRDQTWRWWCEAKNYLKMLKTRWRRRRTKAYTSEPTCLSQSDLQASLRFESDGKISESHCQRIMPVGPFWIAWMISKREETLGPLIILRLSCRKSSRLIAACMESHWQNGRCAEYESFSIISRGLQWWPVCLILNLFACCRF
jgi:hypothetical protein